ncbi:serine/threonine-protein kinase SMG1-like [Homalodisca vitripennis]|uniref:serine/threonine-protein kinase SMG1-like n=1 Tax=Homalodisca vitripennis TaxID=197043 RepID=UPI001EEB1585|nr:serine/threonine-protein kinase SMG1-like [Homalodisca vitripennis]
MADQLLAREHNGDLGCSAPTTPTLLRAIYKCGIDCRTLLETAVDSYMKIVQNESLESPTRHLVAEHSADNSHSAKTLVADQITECYLALQDWTELARWKTSEAELLASQNGGSFLRYKYLTEKDAEALAEFEKESYSAAYELLEWGPEVGDSPNNTPALAWDCYKVLGVTRHSLAKTAVKFVANGIIQDSDREVLRECQAAAHSYLVEGLRNTPSEVVQEAAILEFAANAMLSESEVVVHSAIDGSGVYKLTNVDSTLLARLLWWERVLDKLQIISHSSPQLSLDAARLARKEGNLKLALAQLSHHVNQILHHDNGHRTALVLTDDILADLDRSEEPWSLPHACAFAELSKLLYSVGSQQLALSVATQTCLRLADCEEAAVRERCARLLLTVAKWTPLLDSPASLQQLIDWQRDAPATATSLLDISNFDTEGDPVGSVLYLAVCHCPSLAKTWARLAGWAYRWGRKATDHVLIAADKEAIDSLIPEGISNSTVYSILADTTPPIDDEDIEAENTNASDMIEWSAQSSWDIQF